MAWYEIYFENQLLFSTKDAGTALEFARRGYKIVSHRI